MFSDFFINIMNISQIPLYLSVTILVFQSKTKQKSKGENGLMDLATTIMALGLLTLPIIFMGYVRSRVRHALKIVTGEVR
jgi:hypothetical protein